MRAMAHGFSSASVVTLLVPPLVARAQGALPARRASCTSFLTCLPDTIETILGLGGVVALAGIIWGIYNYLIAKGNQDRIEKGRHSIMASLWLLGALILAHAVFSFFRRVLGI